MSKGLNDLQYESLMAQDIRFDPNDSAPLYIGLNPSTNASDGSVAWIIYKFTYDGANVTRIQKSSGTWTGRAELFQ
jgi:hypothetical protein